MHYTLHLIEQVMQSRGCKWVGSRVMLNEPVSPLIYEEKETIYARGG